MQKFTNRVTEVLDKYAPVRIIQVRRKSAPWLSDQTKDAINIRNQAQQMANLIKTPENIRAYKSVRNKVNNVQNVIKLIGKRKGLTMKITAQVTFGNMQSKL